MAIRIVKSTTAKKVQLPRGAEYKGYQNGKHIYHLPNTDRWFSAVEAEKGWVTTEFSGGCDCG